jgi:large repetitive protein
MLRNQFRKTLKFESLETRRMLAGNITVTQSGSIITLTGDALDNSVLIRDTQTGGGVIQIIGLDTPGPNSTTLPTTINSGASKTLSGITGIVFDFNGGGANINTGNDVIVLTNLTLTGGVTINSGDGNNFYGIGTFDPTQDNKVDLDFDPSLGTLTEGAVSMAQGMTINMGGGANYLRVDQATFNGPVGKNLAINMGVGTTTASVGQTSVAHWAAFNEAANSGQVDLTLDHFSANYLSVNTSIGNDSITLTDGTHINTTIAMSLNLGDDTVDLDGVTAGAVQVLMGQGANSYTGTGDQITSNTSIWSGAESDSVTISGGSTGSLMTALGGGGNTVSLSNLAIANAASVGGGFGPFTFNPDTITLDHVTAGSLKVTGGNGSDSVSLTTVTVAKAVDIDTGNGNDDVTIDGLSGASMWTTLDNGADTISLQNVAITGKAMIGGGAGSNTYTDNGGNSFGTLDKVNFE